MGRKGSIITNKPQEASQKFTHLDVQNKFLDVIAKQVLSKKLERIRKCHFYSIICEEGTDSSNIELLFFNIRTVDKNLFTYQNSPGF